MQTTHMQAQKTIEGVDFPARRDQLVRYAGRHGADQELLYRLRQLPDKEYRSTNEVGAAFTDVFGM